MNANKHRGDTFERAVVDTLRLNGHPHAERALRLGAHQDRGDIGGLPGLYVECRDRGRLELGEWMNEAAHDADLASANYDTPDLIPVVIVKRRGAHVGRSYVVVELVDFARLIQ